MSYRSRTLGVTLLEILLVLAIAGMIIVMSIRYYQSASSSGQANSAAQQVQAIVAAEESVVQSTGTYVADSNTQLTALLPPNSDKSPWGGKVSVTAAGNTFTIALTAVPAGVCANLNAKILTNNRFSTASTCGAGPSAMSYLYQ